MNQRPLGYESARGLTGNPLISRRMCGTTSNYWFLADSSTCFSFEGVSGCYGSKTGADDLWVLPKAVLATFTGKHRSRRRRSNCRHGGTETRLSIPGPDINDYSLAGLNHGLGTTDINSGAGNPASPGSLEDPLPIIRQAHMSSRSSLLGSPVRLSPSPKPRLSIVSRWE